MNRGRKHYYGKPLLGKLAYTGSYNTPTTIKYWQFNDSNYDTAQVKNITNLPCLPENNHRLWVQVCGLSAADTIVALGKHFEIKQNDLQDIFTADHVTKTAITNDSILLVVKDFYYDEQKELRAEHVCLLLYRNYVISFQETTRPIFEKVCDALETNTNKVREKTIDYLFCILLDSIVNSYVEVIYSIEQELERMEECLVTPSKTDDNIGVNVINSRKDIQRMKRSIIPLKEQLPRLTHPDDTDIIRKENISYLIDVNDHLQLVVQLLEACREEVNALFDLNIANNDLRMNEIMKRLTVVATIFIPLTFFVGLWGMNFNSMPETQWKYGYLFAWIILLAIGIGTWWYLVKRKWF